MQEPAFYPQKATVPVPSTNVSTYALYQQQQQQKNFKEKK